MCAGESFLITNYKEAIGAKASEDLKASVEEVESCAIRAPRR